MKRSRGFTLLEVVVAMAIMGLALMAIFDLNAGAISMHAYAKKLTVASMLARSKMTDLEQELYDKGFPLDDDERSGDFSSEGWSAFKWRAQIIAPRTQGVSTNQLLNSILNIPTGGTDPGIGGLLSMFGGAPGGNPLGGAPGPLPLPGGAAPGATGAAGGPMAGLAQAQMTQFLDQIRQAVREVRLTVTWKDGKREDSVDVVTHVVSLGPGSDRNGTASVPGLPTPAINPGDPLVNPRTGIPVSTPTLGPNGQPVDPSDPTAGPLVPQSVYQSGRKQ